MSEIRWTLDPAIEAFLATITLPPDDCMRQHAAERELLEATAPVPARLVLGAGHRRLITGAVPFAIRGRMSAGL